MIEHRYDKRHHLLESIPVSVFQRGNFAATGKIRNVSFHGVFIETPAHFNKNTYLKVRFTLPNHKGKSVAYQTWGLVTHCERNGLGLHMDVLNPDNLTGLKIIADRALTSEETLEGQWEQSHSGTG